MNDAKFAEISVHSPVQEGERALRSGHPLSHASVRSSRATVADPDHTSFADKQECEVFRLELEEMDLTPNRVTADTLKRIRQETAKDPVLAALQTVVTNSWPSERKEAPEELRIYWNFRDELSAYDDVLYKSHQVIVPSSLRPEMLRKIHKAHQGADNSMRRARKSLFWPGMQAALRETGLSWGICSQFLNERSQEPMKSHEIFNRPWSKVRADIFQLAGSNYLVMVDHYSDFFELDSLRNTTASTVIRAMKRNFVRHGIPDECITDNGPQFDSHEYSSFAGEYGFTMIKSSPYYSRANGKAESAVKIATNILKESRHEDPYLALLAYRNTPQQGYSYSPAQRLMSRRFNDIIPTAPSRLVPQAVSASLVQQNIADRRRKAKAQYDKRASAPLREFLKGEKVYVKPRPTNRQKPWIFGEVIGKPAPRACLVSTPMGPVRRNHAQIREAKVEPPDTCDRSETASIPSESGPTEQIDQTTPTTLVESERAPLTEPAPPRRSTRERRLPARFQDYVM